jgi:hypothetical protein
VGEIETLAYEKEYLRGAREEGGGGEASTPTRTSTMTTTSQAHSVEASSRLVRKATHPDHGVVEEAEAHVPWAMHDAPIACEERDKHAGGVDPT